MLGWRKSFEKKQKELDKQRDSAIEGNILIHNELHAGMLLKMIKQGKESPYELLYNPDVWKYLPKVEQPQQQYRR